MKHSSSASSASSSSAPPKLEPSLEDLPRGALESMLEAGREIHECYRVLKKAGLNIVGECLKGQGTFYQLKHYPKGDVFDRETHSQYYYHAHRGMEGEHGHFHTFLRAGSMPAGIRPVPYEGKEEWPTGKDAVSHLIAISMDRFGFPIGLFATNRWVTAGGWYCARDVVRMVDRFRMDHAYPSWATNRWMGAMFQLFRPQIAALVMQRDDVLASWQERHPDRDSYEDRELEITGSLRITVDEQLRAVRRELGLPAGAP